MDVRSKLIVVHECENCLASLTPSESSQAVNVSGVVQCKTCGHIGPLRVRIVEVFKDTS